MDLKSLLDGFPVISIQGDPSVEVSDVTYDSRKVREGSVFVCIDGFREDGHDYIGRALRNGAAAVVVQRKTAAAAESDRVFVRVNDSRQALAFICSRFFGSPAAKMKTVAVTGDAGKTSLGYLLHHFCQLAGIHCGLINGMETYIDEEIIYGTRNHPGPPEIQSSLVEIARRGCELGVLPVSDQDIALDRARYIPFEIGVSLNSDGALSDRKLRFYQGCNRLVVNRDDVMAPILLSNVDRTKVVTFGLAEGADIRAEDIHICCEKGVVGTRILVTSDRFPPFSVFVGAPGRYNIYNVLALIAVIYSMGWPMEMLSKMRRLLIARGRTQPVVNSMHLQVLIDAAWTPKQLENLLTSLRPYCQRKLIVVCGTGGNRDRSARRSMGRLCGDLADYSFLTVTSARGEAADSITGDLAQGIEPTGAPFERIEDRTEAISKAISMAGPGDIVVLTGKGEDIYEIDNKDTRPVSDLSVARQLLDEIADRLAEEERRSPRDTIEWTGGHERNENEILSTT